MAGNEVKCSFSQSDLSPDLNSESYLYLSLTPFLSLQSSPSLEELRDFQIMQAFDVALGFLLELDGKILLAEKIAHFKNNTWRIQDGMIWKPPPRGLALLLSEGAMQTAKGDNQSTVLHGCKAYAPQQWPASKITPRVQWWHSYLGDKQQISI